MVQMVPQPMMMMMPVQTSASILQSQIPNAPPTLIVDTSQQAMQAQGLPTLAEEVRPRSILKRPNSPSRFRSSGPPNQSAKTSFSINKLDTNEGISSSTPSSTRINIVKEG